MFVNEKLHIMNESEFMLARKYEIQDKELGRLLNKLRPECTPALIEDSELRELVRHEVSQLKVRIGDKFRALFEGLNEKD
jgi:hypothetical protein